MEIGGQKDRKTERQGDMDIGGPRNRKISRDDMSLSGQGDRRPEKKRIR